MPPPRLGALLGRDGLQVRRRQCAAREFVVAVSAELGAEFLHHDVSSEADWASVVADVAARHGRLDILMNNAGIFEGARLVNTSTEMWDRVMGWR